VSIGTGSRLAIGPSLSSWGCRGPAARPHSRGGLNLEPLVACSSVAAGFGRTPVVGESSNARARERQPRVRSQAPRGRWGGRFLRRDGCRRAVTVGALAGPVEPQAGGGMTQRRAMAHVHCKIVSSNGFLTPEVCSCLASSLLRRSALWGHRSSRPFELRVSEASAWDVAEEDPRGGPPRQVEAQSEAESPSQEREQDAAREVAAVALL
jgi:hypothetical protein